MTRAAYPFAIQIGHSGGEWGKKCTIAATWRASKIAENMEEGVPKGSELFYRSKNQAELYYCTDTCWWCQENSQPRRRRIDGAKVRPTPTRGQVSVSPVLLVCQVEERLSRESKGSSVDSTIQGRASQSEQRSEAVAQFETEYPNHNHQHCRTVLPPL